MEKESIILLASVISALATVFLAYLTARYVKLTYEMVVEIKKARNPLVIIKLFKRMEGIFMTGFDIIISNKGLSPAKDINLRTFNELSFVKYQTRGDNDPNIYQLNELPIFKNGIPYLSPGDEVRDNIGELQNEDIPESPLVKINFSYKTETNETIYHNIILDLRYLPKEE